MTDTNLYFNNFPSPIAISLPSAQQLNPALVLTQEQEVLASTGAAFRGHNLLSHPEPPRLSLQDFLGLYNKGFGSFIFCLFPAKYTKTPKHLSARQTCVKPRASRSLEPYSGLEMWSSPRQLVSMLYPRYFWFSALIHH